MPHNRQANACRAGGETRVVTRRHGGVFITIDTIRTIIHGHCCVARTIHSMVRRLKRQTGAQSDDSREDKDEERFFHAST